MIRHLHKGAIALAVVLVAAILTGCTTGDGNLVDMIRAPWSLGCCGLLILILDIIAIIEVAGSARSMGSKVLWIIVIVVFPLLGCLLYYFFGR